MIKQVPRLGHLFNAALDGDSGSEAGMTLKSRGITPHSVRLTSSHACDTPVNCTLRIFRSRACP